MACPYFMPMRLIESGHWPHPARLPLGAGWEGHCTAPGHEGTIPTPDELHDGCNLGYALRCSRLPAERSSDSVRFAIAREESAQITLHFVCEREHRPAVHGQLCFDRIAGTWKAQHRDARVQRMADCFLQTHLRRSLGLSPAQNDSL